MATLLGGTLSIDVGGSGIKGMVLDPDGRPVNERVRIETPRPATPEAVLGTLGKLIEAQPAFERISVGFPGVVVNGRVETAPNLDGNWRGFPLAEALATPTGRPVRVANDADVQGLGVVEGRGVELVVTLGTGVGSGLYIDGILVPNLELGHHPFRKGDTYEQQLGNRELAKVGKARWNKRVRLMVDQLAPIFNFRLLYLGGGNAQKVKVELPSYVRVVDNLAGILGGIRLWRATL